MPALSQADPDVHRYWFANVDDSPGAEGLVVQPGINSIKDLKGEKIAVTLAPGAEITLY